MGVHASHHMQERTDNVSRAHDMSDGMTCLLTLATCALPPADWKQHPTHGQHHRQVQGSLMISAG